MAKDRFRVDMITQDGEPEPLAVPIAYFATLDAAAREVATLRQESECGCYYAVYDRERESYTE